MTPTLRDALAAALALAPAEVDEIELLVHVSAIGQSHAEPGLRLFAWRGDRPLASVKRLARPPAAARELLLGAYARFAAAGAFAVPALLAWREDDAHLYLVETLVPGEPLAVLLERGAIAADDAAARLAAVLAALWELGRPATGDEIAAEARALRATATTLFGDQLAADLAGVALDALCRQPGDGLRRVLTTRDVHLGNLHVDGDGRTWLTDFDLTAETCFFGLDVVRAWVHSAPLLAAAPPPYLPAAAYRLCQLLYPLHEYALQAPLLAEPEREALRLYAQDLFVRLALPAYHGHVVARPQPQLGPPPQAQVFFADATSAFSEPESLRLPFDLDSGRATLATVVRSQQPLRAVRLDPINLAHSVVTVHRWTIAGPGAGDPPLDAAARSVADGEQAGLLALPGRPRTFFAADDDPHLVAPLEPPAGADGPCTYALEVELELQRDWALPPALSPALLLGRLQARVAEVDAARRFELAQAHHVVAAARRQARAANLLALAVSGDPPPARPPAGLDAVRARLARLPAELRAAALGLASAARQRLRRPPAAPPAPGRGLVPVAGRGRVWSPPHVAVLVDGDAPRPAAAAAQAWAAAQTCASTEVVVWSRRQGLAWDARQPHGPWEARDWPALRATLAARHVAVASPDLLALPPTWLEQALLALEPEDLSFVVAAGDHLPAAVAALAAGHGPGDDGEPLARTVARAAVLADDWTLDLDACRAERGAGGGALGKLLGDSGAPPRALPFARRLRGAPPAAHGAYLLDAPLAGRVEQPIAPVDRVLPLPPLPSPLPTVLMLFPFLAVGGAERVHLDVVRGLGDRIRFVILTLEPHAGHLGSMVGAFQAVTPFVYPAPDALNPLLTTSLVEHLLRRFAPRTLYIANGAAWIYEALPALKRLHPELRTVNQVYDFAAGWIERLDAPLMAALDAHISCNRRISAALVERGARPEAAVTIHNAPDLALFDPAAVDDDRRAALRAAWGLPADRRVIAFVGRLHQQKRPMDVVELARQLRADPSVAFLLVGDGALADTVRAQIAACGLEHVRLRPFHQPSRECYAVADVLVLPSEYEGMPMVILEALAMGVPVVATDVGNNREVLERTGGGRVVERVGDVAALREAVRAVLDAPPDPAALRAAVAREFGMAEKLDAYARVLLG